MALNISNAYAMVFEPENFDKFVKANISTSRKNKNQNGEDIYINSNWKAKFVGKCLDKAKLLSSKDRIKINSAIISNEKSEKVNELGKNIYFVNVTIFDFEMVTPNQSNGNSNNNDFSQDQNDLPF